MTENDTDKLVKQLSSARMPNGRAMSSGEMIAAEAAGEEPAAWMYVDKYGCKRVWIARQSLGYVQAVQESPLYARPGTAPQEQADPRVAALVKAAKDVIGNLQSTYRTRNGRQVGIEADDGEKCMIIHSDHTFALEQALAAMGEGE